MELAKLGDKRCIGALIYALLGKVEILGTVEANDKNLLTHYKVFNFDVKKFSGPCTW